MKLSRALFGALVWCSLLAGAIEQPRCAIAEVQSASGSAGGTSASASFGSAVTAGNLLVVAVGSDSTSAGKTVTIGDSLSNNYTQAGTYESYTGATTVRASLWYAANCAGGANTVTVSVNIGGAFNQVSCQAYEFSGAKSSNPLDQTAGSSGFGSSLTTGSIGASGAGELAVAAFATSGFSLSAGSGWSGSAETSNDPSVILEYELPASGAAATAAGGVNRPWGGAGASFFPAFDAGEGSFALTGQGVTFQGNMVAAEGAFTLSGEPATFQGTWNVGAGAFALTGEAATFQSSQFPAGPGAFTLAGPGATFNGNMQAGEGAFTLAGQPATFNGVWYVGAGNFQINGTSQGGPVVIPLVGSGGLFTRLGKLVGALNDLNNFRGGDLTGQLVKAVVDAMAQLDGDPSLAIRATEATLPAAQTQANAALTAMAKALQASAQNLLITMANNDVPLSALSVQCALTLLHQQMLGTLSGGSYSGGYYVNPQTLGYGWAPLSNNRGNGNIVVGLRDAQGYQLDNLLGEAIAVTVYSDATAGAEQLQLAGAASNADALSSAWPAGSGMSKVLTSLLDSAAGNLVANGSMEAFGGAPANNANVPTGWTTVAGTPGTDFGVDTTHQYLGASCLKLIGGTGALSQITVPQALAVRTPYAVNLQLKASVVPAAGTLVIDLYSTSLGAVLTDEAANNCSLSINLHQLSTSYAPYSIVWQIADPLPANIVLRVRLTTAISGGSTIYLDSLAEQAATRLGSQLGDSGWGAVFGGNVNWALRDTGTLTIANSRTCQWQPAFDRLFSCRQLGYVLPTSGATLIPDSLIGD